MALRRDKGALAGGRQKNDCPTRTDPDKHGPTRTGVAGTRALARWVKAANRRGGAWQRWRVCGRPTEKRLPNTNRHGQTRTNTDERGWCPRIGWRGESLQTSVCPRKKNAKWHQSRFYARTRSLRAGRPRARSPHGSDFAPPKRKRRKNARKPRALSDRRASI